MSKIPAPYAEAPVETDPLSRGETLALALCLTAFGGFWFVVGLLAAPLIFG